MKNNKRGFTLIELLVVVLIIGILAAVAVPQYQKAVDRARAIEGIQLISSLQKATDVYILANPGKDLQWGDLDISFPCDHDNFTCQINKYLEIDYGTGWSDRDGSFYVVYAYYHLTADDYVTLVALRSTNGTTWTHRCGYFTNRGKGICEGLQGYEAEEGFDY